MVEFSWRGRSLEAAVDALMAYDRGATDSGVHDDAMKEAVRLHLRSMMGVTPEGSKINAFELWLARFVRENCLTEERLAQGYGFGDVIQIMEWLRDEMGIDF